MKAGVLYGPEDMRFEEIPIPAVSDGDVLIKVRAVGICGSDIPRVLGQAAHYYPIVLGHEFSGEIVDTGKDVKSLRTGDHVAGVPLLPCFKCEDCIHGWYAQCRHYSFIGSRIQGAFAEFVAVPEKNAVKIGTTISFEQGAFFEPSTVALHGLFCADYRGGEDVAVLGGGNIGIFAVQWARIFGAKRVFVFDIDADRLALASEFGADFCIDTKKPDFLENVMELTGGRGFGFVLETAGADTTMKLAFELAANKAGVCFIGTPHKNMVFEPKLFEKMNRKEFSLTGSWMSYSAPFPGREWELTEHFFSTGVLKYKESLIYKRLPLSDIWHGFQLYKTPGAVKGKIMLINE